MDHAGVDSDRFRSSRDYAAWLGEDRHGSGSLTTNMLEICHAYLYLLDNDGSVLLVVHFVIIDVATDSPR